MNVQGVVVWLLVAAAMIYLVQRWSRRLAGRKAEPGAGGCCDCGCRVAACAARERKAVDDRARIGHPFDAGRGGG